MTSIGETLRRQRLQNRISLEKVALETKIGVRLLEAIEAEQFEKELRMLFEDLKARGVVLVLGATVISQKTRKAK